MTAAETCRKHGWSKGTRLEGTEGDDKGWSSTNVIEITAVGEEEILAKCISHNGKPHPCGERNWSLGHRDWKKVV